MSMLVKKAKASAEAGFTLIELMIVIAIIGILAAIAIPQYEKYIDTAQASDVATNFESAVHAATEGVAAASAGQNTLLVNGGALPAGATGTLPTGGTPVLSASANNPVSGQTGPAYAATGTTPGMVVVTSGATGPSETAGQTITVNTPASTVGGDIASAINNIYGTNNGGTAACTGTSAAAGVCTVVVGVNGSITRGK